MLFREITDIYCVNNTEHINTTSEIKFLIVKPGGT
jgi:hypothetical protein